MIKNLLNSKSILGLLIFSILFFSNCRSGKKRFEKGDYDKATYLAIKRLKHNPNSKKANEMLPIAYKYALTDHLNQIDIAKKSANEFKYDVVVNQYEQLDNLYKGLQGCPQCMKKVPNAKSYQKELNYSRLMASKAHFKAGMRDLEKKTIDDARTAYHHFIKARFFTPNYDKINSFITRSRNEGTIHVLLDDIPVHSRSLALTNEFFQNKIKEYANNLNYTFVQFYRVPELESRNIKPDEVLVMQFDDFVVGQTYFKETVREVKKDSVKIGYTEIEGKKLPVYGQAKASISSFHKSVTSRGLLDVQIVNAYSGETLSQKKFPGTYIWEWDWASYNGQEEALSDDDLNLVKRKELNPPPPQDLFIAFTNPIYNQVTRLIRRYYQDNN